MMEDSPQTESWTTFRGAPVYWLAPEFWTPKTGIVTLVLPGETPYKIPLATRIQRTTEFLKLQGDGRYCDRETSIRMKRLMVERLGTDTPWRGIPPADEASICDSVLPASAPEVSEKTRPADIPFDS
jgi:hypothetical protein